ncbi:hypothetical protein DIPPA_09882 [Diplonema papillatum]|nr:hypothetical protein DIPPA_09882 [Diplonema papillatum]|eukprot:gene20108-30908_t
MIRRALLLPARRFASSSVEWVDPTVDDLLYETAAAITNLQQEEDEDPVACSLALIASAQLGDYELYTTAKSMLAPALGVPELLEVDHYTSTDIDIWKKSEAAAATFAAHPAPQDFRLWLLGRLNMAAIYMKDSKVAAATAITMHELLRKQALTTPEIWACGYLLAHWGDRMKYSESQIRNSPGGVQNVKDPFGLELKRTTAAVKAIPVYDYTDAIWARVMLLYGAANSRAPEHWARLAWCDAASELDVSDYKAWAHALTSHAASMVEQIDDAYRHAHAAMEILKTVPKDQRAPMEDILTILHLRSSFVDLHRHDPKKSKKLSATCCPNIPFVVRGKPPKLLGIPRHALFRPEPGSLVARTQTHHGHFRVYLSKA